MFKDNRFGFIEYHTKFYKYLSIQSFDVAAFLYTYEFNHIKI